MEPERLEEIRAALERLQARQEREPEMKINLAHAVLQAIPIVGLFVALVAAALYYYPELDYAVYRFNPEIHAVSWLTVYHQFDFGWIHTPSLALGIWFCFVLWLVPKVAAGADRLLMMLVLRAKLANAVVEEEDDEADDLPPLEGVPRA